MTVVSDAEEDYLQLAEEQADDDEAQAIIKVESKFFLDTKRQQATESDWLALTKEYAQHNERRLFNYDFEEGGGVGVVIRGSVDTVEALDIIDARIKIKRRELARKAPAREP